MYQNNCAYKIPGNSFGDLILYMKEKGEGRVMGEARTTREEIVQLLKIKGEHTVAELAEALEITEMAIRRHLSNLEK